MKTVKLAVTEVEECCECTFLTGYAFCEKLKKDVDVDYTKQNFPDECQLDEIKI